MPTHHYDHRPSIRARQTAERQTAERQVRAKFPDLIEGSTGWHRAVANRLRRLGL